MKKLMRLVGLVLLALTIGLVACNSSEVDLRETMIENPSDGFDMFAYDWLPELTFGDLIESSIDNPKYDVNVEDPNKVKIYVTGILHDTIFPIDHNIRLEYHLTNNGNNLSLEGVVFDQSEIDKDNISNTTDLMACITIREKFGSLNNYLKDKNVSEKLNDDVIEYLGKAYNLVYIEDDVADVPATSSSYVTASSTNTSIYGNYTDDIEPQNSFDKEFCIRFLNQFNVPSFEDIPFGTALDKFLTGESKWRMEKDENSEAYSILISGTSDYVEDYIEAGDYMLEMAYYLEDDSLNIFYISIPDGTGLDPDSIGYEVVMHAIANNYCTSMKSSFDEYTDYLTKTYGSDSGSFKYREINDALECLRGGLSMSDSLYDDNESSYANQSAFPTDTIISINDPNIVGRWRESYSGYSLTITDDGRLSSNLPALNEIYGNPADTILCQTDNGRLNCKHINAVTAKYEINMSRDFNEQDREKLKLSKVRDAKGVNDIRKDDYYRTDGNPGELVGTWENYLGEVIEFTSDGKMNSYDQDGNRNTYLNDVYWEEVGDNQIYIEIVRDKCYKSFDYVVFGDAMEIFFSDGSLVFTRVGY